MVHSDNLDTGDDSAKSGQIIGSMELLIIASALVTSQYVDIGFVIAAKTIARHKQLEENPKFAEYYLIGTLYSILFTMVMYLLFFALPDFLRI